MRASMCFLVLCIAGAWVATPARPAKAVPIRQVKMIGERPRIAILAAGGFETV